MPVPADRAHARRGRAHRRGVFCPDSEPCPARFVTPDTAPVPAPEPRKSPSPGEAFRGMPRVHVRGVPMLDLARFRARPFPLTALAKS
jgi:hypothetical protein